MSFYAEFLHKMGDPSEFSKYLVMIVTALGAWVYRQGKRLKLVYKWVESQMPKNESQQKKIDEQNNFISELMSAALITADGQKNFLHKEDLNTTIDKLSKEVKNEIINISLRITEKFDQLSLIDKEKFNNIKDKFESINSRIEDIRSDISSTQDMISKIMFKK